MRAAGRMHVRLTGGSGEPRAAHVGDDVGAVRDPERAPAERVVEVPRESGVAHARRAIREHAPNALGQLRARLPQRRRKHHRQRAPQRVACPDNTTVVSQSLGILRMRTASAPPSQWPPLCRCACVEDMLVTLHATSETLESLQCPAASTAESDSDVAACAQSQGFPLSMALQLPICAVDPDSIPLHTGLFSPRQPQQCTAVPSTRATSFRLPGPPVR